MYRNLFYIIFVALLLVGCSNETTEKAEKAKADQLEKKENKKKNEVDKNIKVKAGKPHFFDKYFPVANYKGKLMTPYLNPVENKLVIDAQQRMQAAIRENEDWFKKEIASLKPGEPLPYDKRLGVTKDEYEMITTINENIKLIHSNDYNVEIRKDDDVLVISMKQSPLIKEFKISNDGETITTERGVFKKIDTIKASAEQKLTGKWSGYAYKKDDSDIEEINLGQLDESGEIIIRTILDSEKQEIIYLDPKK